MFTFELRFSFSLFPIVCIPIKTTTMWPTDCWCSLRVVSLDSPFPLAPTHMHTREHTRTPVHRHVFQCVIVCPSVGISYILNNYRLWPNKEVTIFVTSMYPWVFGIIPYVNSPDKAWKTVLFSSVPFRSNLADSNWWPLTFELQTRYCCMRTSPWYDTIVYVSFTSRKHTLIQLALLALKVEPKSWCTCCIYYIEFTINHIWALCEVQCHSYDHVKSDTVGPKVIGLIMISIPHCMVYYNMCYFGIRSDRGMFICNCRPSLNCLLVNYILDFNFCGSCVARQ